MMRALRRRLGDDSGFTLIELLVSIAILTIILSAISAAMITFLRTGTYASQRDDHSAGAILLSAYLDRDLASADTVSISVQEADNKGKVSNEAIDIRCGGSNGFTLTWQDYVASSASPSPAPSTTYTATYTVTPYDEVFEGISRVRCRLTRAYSVGGGTADKTIIAENLYNGTSGGTGGPRAVVADDSESCGSTTQLVVEVRQYEDDTNSPPYSYAGCVKGRVP